ncbi:MAG: histidine--tRNA ligase [Endomicrobium sp.]|jgi:histidyl-tRNA synthetase|nr:histidine--tRNA ligase [Endomicrobium sp.]
MNYRAPRGTHDIFGEDAAKMSWLEQKARDIFKKHGFEEVRTPIFEESSLFIRSVGQPTDIVEKEMYTFEDKKGRKLALRPEGTTSLVRAFIEHKMDVLMPVSKFFYAGEMFRYERPQSGRYRQFHQIGAEFFCVSSPVADAEIILLACDLLDFVGINEMEARFDNGHFFEMKVHLNSLGCRKCRHVLREKLVEYLISLSNLCENCLRRLVKNPLRILDCKTDSYKFTEIPQLSSYLCDECKHDFDLLKSLLEVAKCDYVVDNKLVRGLDYYTKTVFEICCSDILSSINSSTPIKDAVNCYDQNFKPYYIKARRMNKDLNRRITLAAGGRYDNLVKDLSGQDTPAVGFALGSERVLIVAEKFGSPEFYKSFRKFEKVYVAIADQELFKEAFSFAVKIARNGLKNSKDISVFGPINDKSLTWQLKFADKIGARKTIIFVKTEFKKGKVLVKNMENKVQTEASICEL